jgi:AcrR family transcriptional regulator
LSAELEHLGDDPKRAAIASAAIDVFSARGFARTSMAHIAEEAGMSRPALYQYFENKGDIFGCAFAALVEGAADRALAALDAPTDVVDQLDGFLQHFDGAFWERTAASPYGDELLDAKAEYAPQAIGVVMKRIRRGLERYFKLVGPRRRSAALAARRKGWIDLLEFAPRGFKLDRPPIAAYRRRLRALAESVAADMEASRSPR